MRLPPQCFHAADNTLTTPTRSSTTHSVDLCCHTSPYLPALLCCQVANQAGTDDASRTCLQTLLPAVVKQCEQWLQAHSTQQQQQQPGHDLVDAAVRWRNRCMRSIWQHRPQQQRKGPVHLALPPAAVLASWLSGCLNRAGVRCMLCMLLVPIESLLLQSTKLPIGGCSRPHGSCISRLRISWLATYLVQLLGSQQQQQQQDTQLPVVLCYEQLQELQQHSRNMQLLQQLLLQLHVEQRLAPTLMECLLKGCLQLHKAAPDSQQQERPRQHQVLPHGGGTDLLQERCLALYRLLHFLAAAAAKQRGLTASFHVAEAEVVEDVDLLRYSQW
ncbi:hypothetical protein COO60DRAFT_831011 [Scenedesmus sp. NREL 46B-D3]|nr:hypothetical protein COO60DRAFT_831011 [Scenedesmus sp. NREL 46B-D3]